MTDPDLIMRTVHTEVRACRVAHDHLLDLVGDLEDDDVRAPSALPDWTVGHVLTHLARNGDSVVHLARAVAAGEVADQYPGGAAQRAEGIEAGAGRSAADLVADVRATNDAVHVAWDALGEDQWLTGVVQTASGRRMPASYLPTMRWREVVVHTSDLGLAASTWRDWPDDYVATELPALLELLAARLDPTTSRALVAHLMGRRPEPITLPDVMW